MEVDLGAVVRGPLEVTVDADGMTRVRDNFRVAAPVGGRLQRITLREGDRVESDAILARIEAAPLDPRSASEARARLSAAQAGTQEVGARVAQTRAALDQAERAAARIGVLAAAGAVSLQARELADLDRETAQREHAAARSRLAAAQSELDAARRGLALADLGSTQQNVVTVRAPSGGRVLRVYEPSERVIPPGTPLVDIAEAGRLEIVVDVLSTDAVRIRPGATMHVVNWGGADTLRARVRLVEPSGFTKVSALGVEEQRVRVIADLVDSAPGIGDGYRVEARIVTWTSPEVVKVPTASIFRVGEGWGVFVVMGGRARLRRIEIGERGAEEAEVCAGLIASDVVVLFPPDGLEDGTRVRAR
jgi:HlyD family secretion protein